MPSDGSLREKRNAPLAMSDSMLDENMALQRRRDPQSI